eukprot:scaffold7425_cov363-Prasinococcus_capsulatus_cf.AAC.2
MFRPLRRVLLPRCGPVAGNASKSIHRQPSGVPSSRRARLASETRCAVGSMAGPTTKSISKRKLGWSDEYVSSVCLGMSTTSTPTLHDQFCTGAVGMCPPGL